MVSRLIHVVHKSLSLIEGLIDYTAHLTTYVDVLPLLLLLPTVL